MAVSAATARCLRRSGGFRVGLVEGGQDDSLGVGRAGVWRGYRRQLRAEGECACISGVGGEFEESDSI